MIVIIVFASSYCSVCHEFQMVSEVAPSASQSHLIVSYVFRVVIELASSASQPCGVDPTLCSALHALKNGAVVFVMCSQQRYTTYTTEVHNILKKTAQKTCELDPLPKSLRKHRSRSSCSHKYHKQITFVWWGSIWIQNHSCQTTTQKGQPWSQPNEKLSPSLESSISIKDTAKSCPGAAH